MTLSDKADKLIKSSDQLLSRENNAICISKISQTGRFIDIATGKVFLEQIDFKLPGPIPLIWKRTWYSTSKVKTALGVGWHNSYDMLLTMDKEGKVLVLRAMDGRSIIFPAINSGQVFYHRAERIQLINDKNNFYFINSNGHKHVFGFVNPGDLKLLQRIETIDGHHSVKFYYNGKKHLNQIKDSSGRVLNVSTNHQGNILSITTEIEKREHVLVYYNYNDSGNLITAANALGHATRFKYSSHLIAQVIDKNGHSLYYDYNSRNVKAKCIRAWGDGGLFERFFTYENGETTVENSLGDSSHYYHNSVLVTKVIDGAGRTSLYKYTNDYLLLSETDANELTTTYGYDAHGNRISIIRPDGAKMSYKFGSYYNPEITIDCIGNTWVNMYDEYRNLISAISPNGDSSSYVYDNGFLTKLINGDEIIAYNYDDQGNLIRTSSTEGITELSYDGLGNLTTKTDNKGNIEKRTYDKLGNVVRHKTFDGNIKLYEYDGEGNVVFFKDRLYEQRNVFNGAGSLVAQTTNTNTIKYSYNTENTLIAITNQKNETLRFTVNQKGEVIEERDFAGRLRKFKRNKAGLISSLERATGKSVKYKYDKAGRVIEVNYGRSLKDVFRYRHDGAVMYAANNHTEVFLERDEMGRATGEKQGGYEVSSGYDKNGKIKIESSLGASLIIKRNRRTGIIQSIKSQNWELEQEVSKDGAQVQRLFPGDILEAWEYDKFNRPLEHRITDQQGTSNRQYNWNDKGKIKSIADSIHGITYFDYDSMGNLIKSTNPNGKIVWKLRDELGNIYKSKDRKYREYGPGGRLLKDGQVMFNYDAEGNLVERKVPGRQPWKYIWDNRGMLTTVFRSDGKEVFFTYDALGRRIRKEYLGITTHWFWDGDVPLHEWQTRDTANNENPEDLITWVYDDNRQVPMAKLNREEQFSIITDHEGVPLRMYNSNGEKTWECVLNIYGDAYVSIGEQFDFPFRSKGQYQDEETGLHYSMNGYYHPKTGCWLLRNQSNLELLESFAILV